MGGSVGRRMKRQMVRNWVSHEAITDFQKAAAGGMEAYKLALTTKRMVAELARELHNLAVIDLTDKTKFGALSREIFGNAEAYTYSRNDSGEQSPDAGETDTEAESVHPGVYGGPVERDSSSDQSGVRTELGESDSQPPAGEPGDQVRIGEALHGSPRIDLNDPEGQPITHPVNSEDGIE